MADKPLVLTKPNVCATLERRKFQTRRIIKRIPPYYVMGKKPQSYGPNDYAFLDRADPISTYPTLAEPRFQVGDRAYVAEGYQLEQENLHAYGVNKVTYVSHCGKWLADNSHFDVELSEKEYDLWSKRKYPYRKTPGRFMYKSLVRIFLPIVEVRVERLQDISEDDIISEGCPEFTSLTGIDELYAARRWWWNERWNSIHGNGAGDLNPWVFVYRWDEIIIKGK